MSWNKAKILKVVNFPAQAEHNKAVNLPLEYAWLFFPFFFNSHPLQELVMEMLANASSSATSCAKSSSVHHRPLADM